MEPQVEIYCKKDRKKDCSCLWIIIAIISVLLSFFVGVFFETIFGLIALLGIGATITLIITLLILLIIAIVALICCKKTDKKKNCCC